MHTAIVSTVGAKTLISVETQTELQYHPASGETRSERERREEVSETEDLKPIENVHLMQILAEIENSQNLTCTIVIFDHEVLLSVELTF